MEWNEKLWKNSVKEFAEFMTPLTATVGRTERRVAATRYIEGLLIPGQRKSIEPMAERLGVNSQSLQQFVTDSPWSDDAMWTAIRREVIPSLEPIEAWIVDETGWLKQGQHSVGVGHQYCGAVGKSANCQVSVEVAVSDGWIAAPVAGRLYLPQSWTDDRARCKKVGVPEDIEFATKPLIAVDLLEDLLRDGIPSAPVLADAVYGDNAQFRKRVRDLDLEFFVQVDPGKHKGWDHEVHTVMKQKRRHVVPDTPPSQTLQQLAASIPAKQWKDCSWSTANGQTRTTRIAWREVFLSHNLRHQNGTLERVWLVVDWPAGDAAPYHYYLAHFHKAPRRARCLKLSRSRWQTEQYFQRAKDDLGLDHFEGRSWRGFHHHLVLAAIAYLFILTVYLRTKKNFWCHLGTDSATDSALAGEVDRLVHLL
jgi:SRSO17 transposase